MGLNDLIYAMAQLLFAALISFVTTPLASVIAYKTGAIDIPSDERRMHDHPIPLLGGLAIYFGFVITTAIFCSISSTLISVWLGGTIIVAMGVLDDMFNLNPLIKLAVQICVAFVAVSQDVVISYVDIFGHHIEFGNWSILVTVIWIVGLTNAINLIDGLDGLACGVSAICSFSLMLIAILTSQAEFAITMAILAGSCLGFLPFNSNPAKIFMGDTGSLFLGYTLSVLSIQGLFKMHAVLSFVVPIALFAIPLSDTVFAFFRRLFHKQNPFKADRGHIHHRLLKLGFNQKQAVWILYAICGLLGMSSVLFTKEKPYNALFSILICIVILFVNLKILESPKLRRRAGFMLDLKKNSKNSNVLKTSGVKEKYLTDEEKTLDEQDKLDDIDEE